MFLLRFDVKRIRFLATAIFICSICILTTISVISQPKLPSDIFIRGNNDIRLGIRTAAYPIGRIVSKDDSGRINFDGFCETFRQGLEAQILSKYGVHAQVIPRPIRNQHDENKPRFVGLLLDNNDPNKVDVECGPNSKTALTLEYKGKPYSDRLIPSDVFYTTDFRFLLRKELAETLAKSDDVEKTLKELQQQNKLQIAVVNKTTTYEKLKISNFFSDKPYPDRSTALDNLTKYTNIAFAGDAVILKTLQEQGVPEDPSAPTNEQPETPRKPYKNNEGEEFTLFPNQGSLLFPLKGSLAALPPEEYVIITGKDRQNLLAIINETLDNVVRQGQQKIKMYEVYGEQPPDLIKFLKNESFSFFLFFKQNPSYIISILIIISIVAIVLIFAFLRILRQKKENQSESDADNNSLEPSLSRLEHLSASPIRNQVFISYSHYDSEWLSRLQRALIPYMANRSFEIWDDTRIQPGDEWRIQIENALSNAKIAILLVSIDFLSSDFINRNELPPLLNAAADRGLKIIWVPIRPSGYAETPIAKYQAAYPPKTPLSTLPVAQQDEALIVICKKIRDAVRGSAN